MQDDNECKRRHEHRCKVVRQSWLFRKFELQQNLQGNSQSTMPAVHHAMHSGAQNMLIHFCAKQC
jgi:hypothetical protein